MKETSKINPNGLAIVEALSAHKGETLSFNEVAHLAGIEAKTGYLTAAKKIASNKGMAIEKVADGVTVTINTVTVYPSGLKVEAEKTSTVAGYRLIDKAE